MAFDYLRQSLFFFRQHWGSLAAIQLPFLILLALINYLLLSDSVDITETDLQFNAALAAMLRLMLLPFYLGGTILYLQSVIDGQPLRPLTAVLSSTRSWGRLLLTYILNALAVSLGLMLLVVPGVYFGVRFAVADYSCVLEGRSPMEAMRQSWTLTPEYFWVLLQGLALLMGLMFLANMLLNQLLAAQPLPLLLASVLLDFIGVLVTIYGFRVYCVIRSDQTV